MAADLVGRLGCDALPIALEFMRKHAVEQSGGQIDLANEFELGQFILNAGQARLSRIAAQPQQQRRRRCRGLIGKWVARFVRGGGTQQRLQPLSCRRRETPPDAGAETLVMSMDRSADDTVDAISRGRLDRKLATPRPQKRNELVWRRSDSRDLISQP